VDKIEQVYDTFESIGIQIVSGDTENDSDPMQGLLDDLDMTGADLDEEESLVDPVELAAEYNLDDPVRMYRGHQLRGAEHAIAAALADERVQRSHQFLCRFSVFLRGSHSALPCSLIRCPLSGASELISLTMASCPIRSPQKKTSRRVYCEIEPGIL